MARQTKPNEPKAVAPETAVQFKKPDLFEQVVGRTNLKKRDVKPAVEAALAVISDALIRGDEVILPPMGKLRVVKSKAMDGGAQVLTLKLRTTKNASVENTTRVAETDNEG